MELSNAFEIDRSIEETWKVLVDVERIAPCLPGAQLQEIEGDEYRGIVKVKVGPITAQYKGAAVFVEQDDANHKAVLKGDGRDTRGAGNASAIITAQLSEVSPTRTKVSVDTDLTITGKVAQFGRGVMADVSAKLMDQFATNLAELMEEGGASAPAEAAPVADTVATSDAGEAPKVRQIHAPEPEAVDLLDTAGMPVIKRVAPLIGIALLIFLLRRFLRG